MIASWSEWAVLIIGIIISAFFTLGIAVFFKQKRRLEPWFVLPLIIGIILIIAVFLL